MNNVVATLMTQPYGNLKSMLSSIIPPDVAGDITKFGNMVTNLNNANAVYILLGNSLPPAPPGMNMGDVAQKAAVAYLMQTIFTAVTGVVGAGNEIPKMSRSPTTRRTPLPA